MEGHREQDDGQLVLDRPARYRIRVQGRLDEQWSDWLSGMAIVYRDGVTTLTGAVADQSALIGILTRIVSMNVTLVSVNRLDKQEG